MRGRTTVTTSLGRSAQRLSFLAGAGVSVGAGLPTADAFLHQLFDAIGGSRLSRECLRLSATRGGDLRFEGIMSRVAELYDGDLEVFRCLDAATTPSRIHDAVATCATKGSQLVTSNFDDLLERAIEACGAQAVTVDAARTRSQSAS